ncbi:hypothetical protein NMG60_11015036 [Bertholletia excelsa]
MDEGSSGQRGTSKVANSVRQHNQETNESSRNSAEQPVSEMVVLVTSNERDGACSSSTNGDMNAPGTLNATLSMVGSNNVLKDSRDDRHSFVIHIDDGTSSQQGISGAVNTVHPHNQESYENSRNSAEHIVCGTAVLVRSDEGNWTCSASESGTLNAFRNLNAKLNELRTNDALDDERKMKDPENGEHSLVIDVKSGSHSRKGKLGENLEAERFCRICYLTADPSSETSITTTVASGLIQLGCDCKDELGIVHAHCAEAWFKLKGNRLCEICGETAKNITDVGDNRFIEEWNETRSAGGANASDSRQGCWRGQPLCNFLMACLELPASLPLLFTILHCTHKVATERSCFAAK